MNQENQPSLRKSLWSDDLLFGIPKIDREHRILIECIEEFLEAVQEGHGEEAIGGTLVFLEKFTGLHFESEERILKSIKFSGLANHLELHQTFQENLRGIKQKLLDHGDTKKLSAHLRFILFTWYTNHIKGFDKQYVKEYKEKLSSLPPSTKYTLWSDKLVLGVIEIDNEHKALVEVIEDLVNSISQKKHFSKGLIALTTRFVQNYTDYHFAHEERMLQRVNYPDLDAHKQLHQQFIHDVNELAKYIRLYLDADDILPKVQSVLVTWLVEHIVKEDTKIVAYLQP